MRNVVFCADGADNGNNTLPTDLLTNDPSIAPSKQRKTVIDARISQHLFLARNLRLPKAAKRRILAAALLDLRQRTPFLAEEVYWALEEAVIKEDHLLVRQWIAKKSDIERWRKRLDKQGYSVRQIWVDGVQTARPLVDFSDEVAPYHRMVSLLNAGLFTSVACLWVFTWLYPAWIAQKQTLELEYELRSRQQKAVQLRREIEHLRGKDAQRVAFLDMVLRRPLLVETLRELTVALPDEVWITALTYSPQRLVISAQTSGSAAQTTLKLSQRRALGSPQLSGTVQTTADGSERFELTITRGADK